jgi:hypothetical protein
VRPHLRPNCDPNREPSATVDRVFDVDVIAET